MKILSNGALALTLAVTLICLSGCTPSIEGNYSNANGTIVLDLKSDDKASLTFLGETKSCFYQQAKNQIKCLCAKATRQCFTRHEDGSLTGPGAVGVLQKTKNKANTSSHLFTPLPSAIRVVQT